MKIFHTNSLLILALLAGVLALVPEAATPKAQATASRWLLGGAALYPTFDGRALYMIDGPDSYPMALSYRVGSWGHYETLPIVSQPLPTPQLPTDRVSDPHQPGVTYFEAVGHTLRGQFLQYWQEHGGLAQFGYPLTEEYSETSRTDGKPYTTQYFERARFEYHPENQPPYDVLLGLLGLEATEARHDEVPFRYTPPKGRPGGIYFAETGHSMADQFISYWQDHGGLPVYGYPISEAFMERSATDGKTYLVQYFERNRLEFHPELPADYEVSLGLLGVDLLRMRGWLP